MDDEHRTPRFTFRNHNRARVEAALDQHGGEEIEACVRQATEERRGDQERFQIEGADSHDPI